MRDIVTEVSELLLMAVALIALLRLAQFLSSNGAFTEMPVTRQQIGPVLVGCTEHASVRPGLHDAMTHLSTAARGRGVEEERSVMGDDALSVGRGELVGVYHAVPHPLTPAPAELGVVLDVGENRVTEEARVAWEKRLRSAGVENARAKIIAMQSTFCVTAVRGGRVAEVVTRFRAYRKLLRKWRKDGGRGQMNVVIEMVSQNRDRVLLAVPIDCTKAVYRS